MVLEVSDNKGDCSGVTVSASGAGSVAIVLEVSDNKGDCSGVAVSASGAGSVAIVLEVSDNKGDCSGVTVSASGAGSVESVLEVSDNKGAGVTVCDLFSSNIFALVSSDLLLVPTSPPLVFLKNLDFLNVLLAKFSLWFFLNVLDLLLFLSFFILYFLLLCLFFFNNLDILPLDNFISYINKLIFLFIYLY